MAKKTTTIKIDLTEMPCVMGKYSNNIQYEGKSEKPYWAVPFTGLMLPKAQAIALFHDKLVHNCLFDLSDPSLPQPCEWLTHSEIKYVDSFDRASVDVTLVNGNKPEFVLCRVKVTSLQPRTGGLVETDLQVHIFPNREQMILIHEHQNTVVKLSISNAKVAERKKSNQKDMFDENGNQQEASGEESQGSTDADEQQAPPVITGAGIAAFHAAAGTPETNLEGEPEPNAVDETGEIHESGEPTDSAEASDKPADTPTADDIPDGKGTTEGELTVIDHDTPVNKGATEEDLKGFEEGVRKNVADFSGKGGSVDGTTAESRKRSLGKSASSRAH